uniref:Uncharacterized protein n=1 Tax=Trichogramma kaykai TaxID=54128 RepID=A0ABD2XI21_9HYME
MIHLKIVQSRCIKEILRAAAAARGLMQHARRASYTAINEHRCPWIARVGKSRPNTERETKKLNSSAAFFFLPPCLVFVFLLPG